MGVWEGINQGLDAVIEQKTRKKELQQERELRAQEREQDWQRQVEMFKMQQTQGWQEALYTQYAKREESIRAAKGLRSKANTFLDRIGDIDDPRVEMLASNPVIAAQLEDQYLELQKSLEGKGIKSPPLQGQALLDALTVQGSGGQVIPVDITPEDIAAINSQEDFFKTFFELSQPVVPEVYAAFKPEAYFVPDADTLKEGTKLFDDLVLQEAMAARQAMAGDTEESAKLDKMIEGYAKDGSAERYKLRQMFGPSAASQLMGMTDNPYLQGLEQNPLIEPFIKAAALTEQQTLKAIADNPGTPPDQRQEAIDILKTKHGIDYQRTYLNGR